MTSQLNQVDLAFIVDTTGSMAPFIEAARAQMIAMLRALAVTSQTAIDLRVGLVEYRDHPPQDNSFVTRAHHFTSDFGRTQRTIEDLKPEGGGDEPEAVYDGVHAACDQLTWRPHSQRLAVLIGDAPPHGYRFRGDGFANGCPCGLTSDSTTALVEQNRVVLYALGLTPTVTESFSRLAHYTGGEYFEAAHGDEAIETLKSVLMNEFSDLDFDRQVLALCTQHSDWTIDLVGQALASPRGRVSASLSRLGRRGLLHEQ